MENFQYQIILHSRSLVLLLFIRMVLEKNSHTSPQLVGASFKGIILF